MKFRRYYHSFATIEAGSLEECDNVDVTDQILKNLMVCQTRVYPYNDGSIVEENGE